jgi:hypothetical protein
MYVKFAAGVLISSLLAGCGGDETSGNRPVDSGPIIISGPDGTLIDAIKVPASPPYQSARDFSVNRNESDVGAYHVTFQRYGQAGIETLAIGTEADAGSRIRFEYYADPKRYVVNFLGQSREFRNITSHQSTYVWDEDYDPTSSSPYRFARAVSNISGASNFKLDYVGIATWSSFETIERNGGMGLHEHWRHQLYGARTLASDMPKSGTWSYRFPPDHIVRDLEIRFNFAEKTLSGVGNVPCKESAACAAESLGTITLDGTFDSNLTLKGSIGGTAGYSGNFAGGFYGPYALEMGLLGHRTNSSLGNGIFFVMGRR